MVRSSFEYEVSEQVRDGKVVLTLTPRSTPGT